MHHVLGAVMVAMAAVTLTTTQFTHLPMESMALNCSRACLQEILELEESLDQMEKRLTYLTSSLETLKSDMKDVQRLG